MALFLPHLSRPHHACAGMRRAPPRRQVLLAVYADHPGRLQRWPAGCGVRKPAAGSVRVRAGPGEDSSRSVGTFVRARADACLDQLFLTLI
eukprot:350521-Chlamydomonas_euryale.AAC.5